MSGERQTEERIARNDALFREANERIADATEEYRIDWPAPFVCECADPRCTELIRVELDDYRRAHEDPRRFVVAPGHEGSAGSAVEVVEEHDGWSVVEKVGRAGEVAEDLADDGGPPRG